jgi:hypothetical protein
VDAVRRHLLLVLALVAALLAATPAASAASSYAITSISLDPASTTVVGLLGTAFAHVTVGVRSDPPVATCGPEEPQHDGVFVRLSRTEPNPGSSVTVVGLRLSLVSGSRSEGTWAATWRIGSGFGGSWRISSVEWCNGQSPLSGDSGYSADPATTNGYRGTVTVTATAPPRVTFSFSPAAVLPGARQRVTVRYTNARGTPLANRGVSWGYDTECGFNGTGIGILRLDAGGRVTVEPDRVACLILLQPPSPWVTTTTTTVRFDWVPHRYRFRVVRAVPAARTFPVGSVARVATYVAPSGGRSALQVMVGRTWRTVSSSPQTSYEVWTYVPANVRTSVVVGRHLYRVVASNPGGSMAPTASATFAMTGA